MLDERIIALAKKAATVQLEDRRLPFQAQVNRIKVKLHGYGHVYIEVAKAYQEELRARAEIAWRNLHRAHRSFGAPVNDTLSDDLLSAFRAELDLVYGELEQTFQAELARAPDRLKLHIRGAYDQELLRHETEIEHYVIALRENAKVGAATPAVYYFYGNVGAFQTGAGATANVVQYISTENRESLTAALDFVKATLAKAQDLTEKDKGELIELADDAIAEVGKETPNTRRLFAGLQGLAATLQGIASAQPAWEALRAAAAAIGLNF